MVLRPRWSRDLNIPAVQCCNYMLCLERDKCRNENDADGTTLCDAAASAAGHVCSYDVSETQFRSSGLVQKVKDDTERASEMCFTPGKQDIVIVFAERLFTQMCA